MFAEERAKAMALISPFKGKPSAQFNIDPSAGPRRLDENGHLHLWRVKGYDMNQSLIEIKAP